MNKQAKVYHGQADVDVYAKKDDRRGNVPTASYKQIQEAYKEFLNDLLLEAQEAY